MRYRITLVSLVVAAAAAMALASAASASTLTSPSGTSYTGTFHASSEGHIKIANPIAKIECSSTLEGTNESHGKGITITIPFKIVLFSGCTNSWHVTPIISGHLTIHWKFPFSFKFTLDNLKFDTTRLGVTCVYQAKETEAGTLTDSSQTGGTGTLHVEASIPISGESSGLCGSGSAKWEGSYLVNTPDQIYVDE
jgi:hypothetical protein